MEKINIAIFVSGSGTNCENLIRHFSSHSRVRCALVLSSRPDAAALGRARRLSVPTAVVSRPQLTDPLHLLPLLRRHGIRFIVLAGFLSMIPPFLIDAFPRRIVNLHPSLLPKYGGKGMYGRYVHEAVKAAGETETGITIHWVSSAYDAGEIIAQYRCSLSPSDTPTTIAEKVNRLELSHFPQAVEYLLKLF